MRFVFFALLFCSTLLMASEGANLKTATQINLEPQVRGEEVKTTIHFSNDGSEPLVIDKVKTPCGCTSAELSQKVFQPGESGSFDVTVRTARLSGTYDKTLSIVSNDADQGETPVRLIFDLAERQAALEE